MASYISGSSSDMDTDEESDTESLFTIFRSCRVIVKRCDESEQILREILDESGVKLAKGSLSNYKEQGKRAETKKKNTKKYFPCPRCSRRFQTKVQLDKHKTVHARYLEFGKCERCNKHFNTKMKWILHLYANSHPISD